MTHIGAAQGDPQPVLTVVYRDCHIDDDPPDISSFSPATPIPTLSIAYHDCDIYRLQCDKGFILQASDQTNTIKPGPSSPSHYLAPGSFFRLPCETRIMIYKHLVPTPQKVIHAEGRYKAPNRGQGPKRWELHNKNQEQQDLKPPLLTQICTETREYMHQFGNFVFRNSDDGGLWWNSKNDILVFTGFDDTFQLNALDGLQGLEHIHHLGIDIFQARYLGYRVKYKQAYDFRNIKSSEREVNGMSLVFFSRNDTEEPEHFLWRNFHHMQSITICFSSKCFTTCGQCGCFGKWRGLNRADCIRLDLTADKNEIKYLLGKFGKFWRDYEDVLFLDDHPENSFHDREGHWQKLESVDDKMIGNYMDWEWKELVLYQEHEHVDVEKEDDYTFSYQHFLNDRLRRTLRD